MVDVPGGELPLGPVDLAVPAQDRYLRVLRLVSASMAATIGLDDDQMDDVRIAVDELGGMLVAEAPPQARLRVTLCGDHGHLITDGGLVGAASAVLLDPVSQLVLDGLDIGWDIHPRRASSGSSPRKSPRPTRLLTPRSHPWRRPIPPRLRISSRG